MSKPMLVLPLGAILGCAALTAVAVVLRAADVAPPGAPGAPTTAPTSALPAAPGAADDDSAIALGRSFESLSAGISFRPPAGLRPQREVGKDEIVEFRTPESPKLPQVAGPKLPGEPVWSLVVGRQAFTTPIDLVSTPDAEGRERPSLMKNTLDFIRSEHYQGFQLLRQNLTNLGNNDVGIIIYRYTKNAERFLAQRAIIQANDRLYYLVAMTTPAPAVDNPLAPDPGEKQAVETFRAVLDTVKLLDREPIRKDQVDRLVRTRSLMTNFTERKLAASLRGEHWRRIVIGGKDVGYQKVVEEPIVKSGSTGINVGIRTRILGVDKAGQVHRLPSEEAPREDSESWTFTTMDRHHEDWSKQTVIDDGKPKTADHPWRKLTEFGTTDLKANRVLVADSKDPQHPQNQFLKGEVGDANQPWMAVKNDYQLHVQFSGSMGEIPPVDRPLPPFYLPQALELMLPRLLPPNEPKTYLFATYVSDAQEVMLRYVEVGREQDVTLAGRPMRAVPITDHLGLEGTVTTHYVNSRGDWLGSETKETKTTILPSDLSSLQSLWGEMDLFKLEDLAGAPVAGEAGGEPVQPNRAQPNRAQPNNPGYRSPMPIGAPAPASPPASLAPPASPAVRPAR